MKECQICKNCYPDSVGTCPKDGMPTIHTISGEPVLEGKYHLEMRLGQGGMGVVYKARHAYLKTQLAIKIILPDLVGNDPQLVTRFRQEALAAAAIRHQNVVAVTDYGVINGTIPFLVMEYVEGESLHDLLTREKRLSPERAFEIMSAICAGVGAAHHQGIVHRDLKPLNIMICSDRPNISQAVKILDFGLAKIKSGELLGSFIQAQTTGLMGSPFYMAPEQWADDEPDARSDIYSLGVMLYQMLVGDVPFKGSSIPAIMKKHISDPPPSFSEMGIQIAPALEAAVMHTLAKEKDKRTPSVDVMIAELREAIYPTAIGIHTTSGGTLPVSTLRIQTNPPRSKVFIDNVPVGESRVDGWITLNGIQSGNHRVKVTHEGYPEWDSDVFCDGTPQQVVVDLVAEAERIPRPIGETLTPRGFDTPTRMSTTLDSGEMFKTRVQTADTGSDLSAKPKGSRLGIAIAAGAGLLILIFGGIAAGVIYKFWVSGNGAAANTANTTPSPTKTETPQVPEVKAEMVYIPGGRFKMGRNDGPPLQAPEHEESVDSFYMDKTEVTNAAFYEFMVKSGYKPSSEESFLAHWENKKPLPGDENKPVRYVNIEDIEAFIAWLSQRDGVKYRLPTEQEWEYAARNGAKGNIYPWGDKFEQRCAYLNRPDNVPAVVATKSCPNEWGAYDLIGNVFEWTSSKAWVYPGSQLTLGELPEPHYMIRGGGAFDKSTGENAITSTFRFAAPASRRSPGLGFRLVRSP
ncbi:MAG TPA: bifunctional serine/threonine-protein kinase/formylglycine-generating enzyme family protein [Pyrinomonadaceae bacterium]|nr:bifunctional serine/threonine-protein kinase/formylglycine-generating enzyme family protein [Pyrinomonadaceae bacterium]